MEGTPSIKTLNAVSTIIAQLNIMWLSSSFISGKVIKWSELLKV